MTFVCVLKSGGIYNKFHVDRLREQIRVLTDAPLVCLTDLTEIEEPRIPLIHNWPGWWSKLELFEHDLGECCYFDLDVIIKRLDWIDKLDMKLFHAMRDAFHPSILNSSVMLWKGRRCDIVGEFSLETLNGLTTAQKSAGDQWWILKHVVKWYEIPPPTVVSFKKHGNLKDAGVVVFHGSPKPWDLPCIPKNELEVLEPIIDLFGNPVQRMLELGNKRNARGVYKHYFQLMGIDHVSVDWNGLDGALKLNLMEPLPSSLKQFDMVTNIGTTEHVDVQYPVWCNIHNSLKCGGTFVSVTPHPEDYVGHGKWYPMKEFYIEYANLNNYVIDKLYVAGMAPRRLIFARMYKKTDTPFVMPNENLLVESSKKCLTFKLK